MLFYCAVGLGNHDGSDGGLFCAGLFWFWSGLDAPGCEQMPRCAEIGSLYLFEHLMMDSIVILADAAPFLEKWAKRSEHTHPILDICLPFGDSRLILQGIGSCLYLLVAMLAEQRGQVGG